MRVRLLAVIALSLPWLALAPAPAFALSLTYMAGLDGPSEFPSNASPGTGFTTVVLDTVAHTLQVDVSFSSLSGTTTAAHIHCCVSPQAATPTAIVATQTPTFTGFPLGVTSGSYSHTFDLTLDSSWSPTFETANGGTAAGAEAALAVGLAQGFAYLDVHSNQFPGGEIRGFLVPEPSPAVLFGSGALSLLWARRRATTDGRGSRGSSA